MDYLSIIVLITSTLHVILAHKNVLKYEEWDNGITKKLSAAGKTTYKYPFLNPTLPWTDRVDDLVGRLTIEEMTNQTLAPVSIPTSSIDRLGIKSHYWLLECSRGIASGNSNSTAFPQNIGLAATFSPDILFNMSTAISYEVRALWKDEKGYKSSLSCFSPVINILRHPLWGRNQETYGEDPYLSSVLVKSFVQGLQGDHPRYIRVNSGCKHFDVHGGPENIPSSRFSFNSKVSMRDWHMTFLPAFKACVEAGSYSMMCSYNAINGIPACANQQLLTNITRQQWGFKGYIVSDDGALARIKDAHHYLNNSIDVAAAAVKAGCNLELNPPSGMMYPSIPEAIKAGKLSEDDLKETVKPLFYTRMRHGEFDPPEMVPYNNVSMSVIQSPEHRALALEAAIKSFVLLKNDKNTLPLKGKYNKVALIGPMANNTDQQFGDYAPIHVNKAFVSTPLSSLSKLAETYTFASGCNDNRCSNYSRSNIATAVTGSDLVFVCLGTGQQVESEGNDRSTIDLPGHQLDLLQDAAFYTGEKVPIILLLFNAGPLDITWAKLSPRISSIMECFFPAQSTGEALYRVLTATGNGDVPAGRLPMTWPAYINQVAPITDYTMTGRTYRYYEGDPLYPFGYGLSYSSFIYSNLYLNPSILSAGQNLTATVKVTNNGAYDADEVVQFYMSWVSPGLPAPALQLVDFKRLNIPRSSSVGVTVKVTAQQMSLWMDDQTGFSIPKGKMVLSVGGQQPNQRTTAPSNVVFATFTII